MVGEGIQLRWIVSSLGRVRSPLRRLVGRIRPPRRGSVRRVRSLRRWLVGRVRSARRGLVSGRRGDGQDLVHTGSDGLQPGRPIPPAGRGIRPALTVRRVPPVPFADKGWSVLLPRQLVDPVGHQRNFRAGPVPARFPPATLSETIFDLIEHDVDQRVRSGLHASSAGLHARVGIDPVDRFAVVALPHEHGAGHARPSAASVSLPLRRGQRAVGHRAGHVGQNPPQLVPLRFLLTEIEDRPLVRVRAVRRRTGGTLHIGLVGGGGRTGLRRRDAAGLPARIDGGRTRPPVVAHERRPDRAAAGRGRASRRRR